MSPLWLALHFPLLPLEAGQGPTSTPRVLVQGHRIQLANAAAQASGVTPGLRLATARALCDALEVRQITGAEQETALGREARHLLALTPQVCLAPPAAVLLEVGGCLKLFGGFQGLLARVDQYRLHCPLTTRLGLGPTPLAAWHLTELPALETPPEASRFQAWLAALPLAALNLEEPMRERLQAPGFRTLGDLFPLPRPALGKRFGASFLDWLQRLLGEKPDPRQPIPAPRPFRARREFDEPVEDLALLETPMAALLAELETILAFHQEEVAAIRWQLSLNNRQQDSLLVRRARPGHDAATWLDLSRRRLEHHTLGAGVLGLTLDTSRPRPRNPALASLFPEPGARPDLGRLLEKLAVEPALRLYRPAIADEHLPEQGEQALPALAADNHRRTTSTGKDEIKQRPSSKASPSKEPAPILVDTARQGDRPAWLLDPPLRLDDRTQAPSWRGRPLVLFPHTERFSQPWQGITPRRYRVAHHPDGLCCWVFQDEEQQWWLQGFF